MKRSLNISFIIILITIGCTQEHIENKTKKNSSDYHPALPKDIRENIREKSEKNKNYLVIK